jgi:hypothetical protein
MPVLVIMWLVFNITFLPISLLIIGLLFTGTARGMDLAPSAFIIWIIFNLLFGAGVLLVKFHEKKSEKYG